MDLVHLLVYVIVLCLILGLAVYALGLLPIAQPFKNIAILALVLILVLILLSLIGVLGPPLRV